jgi:hypothetical protein
LEPHSIDERTNNITGIGANQKKHFARILALNQEAQAIIAS